MWIVRLALRRPYTIGVSAALIFILGVLSIKSMLVDIFPVIDIPVVVVVWTYAGLSAEDVERRIVLISERGISTTVNGVSRIESESIPGVGLIRIYLEPGTQIGAAIGQIGASSQTSMRTMPPGLTPPVIIQFNASNVPVSQLTLRSDSLSEEFLSDYALNFIRIKLFTIPGLSTPPPYGGKTREITVDVEPNLAAAKGLSISEITRAIQSSNLILPAGTARMGRSEYNILTNSSPDSVAGFETIPLKVVGSVPITLREVAKVRDGFADQTNIVRVNGTRAAYLSILKKADASTLFVVESVKKALETLREIAPKGLELKLDFDQSKFVDEALHSVIHEAVVSSLLVSLMVLFFLGSWRSVIVICISIPLSILVGIIGLKLTGNTINIMTLGGLSLAIGMLVDDATVEVENVHRNRALGFPLTVAILNGAEQIALPAIMATLAICIVFFPVLLLEGPARFLFTPMAASVVFSMLASYVLSRTLVPVLCRMLLQYEHHGPEGEGGHHEGQKDGFVARFDKWREAVFEKLQGQYDRLAVAVFENRPFVLLIFGVIFLVTLFLPAVVGSDFFPVTDTGLMKIHLRAAPGTRIEVTEELVEKAENEIRRIIPAEELSTINSMIGVPASWNLAFVPTDNSSGIDAELLIALNKGHKPTAGYMKSIRNQLASLLPGCHVFFQPADIISQVLSFGLSAPIDVQIESPDFSKSFEVAKNLRDRFQKITGAADVNIKQVFDYPALKLNVDRVRAARMGYTERDVASSMLIALSSSTLVAPSYFVNPLNNGNYQGAVKVPLQRLTSVQDLLLTPITRGSGSLSLLPTGHLLGALSGTPLTETLGSLASVENQTVLESVSHSNVQRVLDVTANVEGRDLGGVLADMNREISDLGVLPPGMRIKIRGQGEVMSEAFSNLGIGLCLAIVFVFLLMVVLFQSWLDPFIILTAIPGALVGILWFLLLTGTTINVVSFMGAIMAVGIASANAILVVNFANDIRFEKGLSAVEAALEAGKTRLRPVLMTALAMIIGMIPTALGLGDGGEQNAPLGRAVIGGLLAATVVTLFVIPVVYSYLRTGLPTKAELEARFAAESEGRTFVPHGTLSPGTT